MVCASILTTASAQHGAKHRQDWQKLMTAYRAEHPKEAGDLEQMAGRQGSRRLGTPDLPTFAADAKGIASRDSSAKVINAFAPTLSPRSSAGSADLAPSTKTRLTFEGAGDLEPGTPGGRNMHFGIREHAHGARS